MIHKGLPALALAAGLALADTSASAQSVTLYGVLDTGIEYVSHAGADNRALVRMPANTGSLPSRWGLRGDEDLGGGLHTVFALESGFNVRAGDLNQGGRLFGRQAWVGLSNRYGTLSFGRQYSMTFWVMGDADILGPDLYGSGSLDSYIPNARSDNTIAYKGVFHGLTVGATYSFGRDNGGTGNAPGQGTCAGQTAGQMTSCRQISAMLKYDTAWFGVAGAWDEQRGGNGAAANFFNGVSTVPLTSSSDTDTRWQLNGYVKGGNWKGGAGWLGRRVQTASAAVADVNTDMFYVGAQYQFTPAFAVDGEIFRMLNARQNTRATMATLRGTYFLSKRTAVYTQVAWLGNSEHAAYSVSSGGAGGAPAAGTNQLGVNVGMRHTF
ncbi:membrane protein [Pandoraea terrigena]|uniref:Membrane protein n=1 Tax=Pandoraea terrigena TaxID=2508292 RepID=A0A5E4S927_9BURK|nr:membrane protein [Pandoraea terrigena]